MGRCQTSAQHLKLDRVPVMFHTQRVECAISSSRHVSHVDCVVPPVFDFSRAPAIGIACSDRKQESGGGAGIRTLDASRHAGFQDRCIQPLCHPSVARILGHPLSDVKCERQFWVGFFWPCPMEGRTWSMQGLTRAIHGPRASPAPSARPNPLPADLSNPGCLSTCRFSRPVHSTALPPLRGAHIRTSTFGC